ncbi:MAG TPA: hypothetical protein VJ438_04465 [Candidatus Nanoarchaeia archaeon]|nr:hypothetical protein [Candidatus Nanoarchaeia archaeon]
MKFKKILIIISTILLVVSAFFVSLGITGQVISDLERQTANTIGITLFILSLLGYYFYLKRSD